MKRFALMIVVGGLLAGCAPENKPAPAADTGQAPAAPSQPAAPTVAAPAAPAQPVAPVVTTPPAPVAVPAAKPIPVYELTVDNKVYVFSSVPAMTGFNAGKPQPTVVEKPNFTPGGKTVVIEAADAAEADQIFAGYGKLHPVAK